MGPAAEEEFVLSRESRKVTAFRDSMTLFCSLQWLVLPRSQRPRDAIDALLNEWLPVHRCGVERQGVGCSDDNGGQ